MIQQNDFLKEGAYIGNLHDFIEEEKINEIKIFGFSFIFKYYSSTFL